jgi:hypothetical protein
MIVTAAREAQRVILRRAWLIARRRLQRRHRLDAFEHARHQRRGDAVIAVAPLLCHGNEPRGGELAEMAAGGRPGDTRERGEFAGGERLPAHQRGQHGGARGVADQRRHLDHVCRRDHRSMLARPGARA